MTKRSRAPLESNCYATSAWFIGAVDKYEPRPKGRRVEVTRMSSNTWSEIYGEGHGRSKAYLHLMGPTKTQSTKSGAGRMEWHAAKT